jgi:hypothetical protein
MADAAAPPPAEGEAVPVEGEVPAEGEEEEAPVEREKTPIPPKPKTWGSGENNKISFFNFSFLQFKCLILIKVPEKSKYNPSVRGPTPPPEPAKPLSKVYSRFDGGELPGFLEVWSRGLPKVPKVIDLDEIVNESELSKDQIKSKFAW